MHIDPVARAYAHLDNLSAEEVTNFKPRIPRFNPSGISKCSRLIWYKHVGTVPEPFPGFLRQYGPYGDHAHDQVRTLMYEAGCEMSALTFNDDGTVGETDIVKKEYTHNGQTFTISGRGDGRITVDGEEMYLELKSVDAYKFRNMRNAYLQGKLEDHIRKEWDSYIQQCNLMMALLGLDKTYLVLINRSNCQFGMSDRKFENQEGGLILKFDQELWEKQLNKMAMITRKADEGVPPMRGKSQGSRDCQQCAYETKCWGAE